MKILITGGTGTISSGLVQESVRQGHEVYTLTRGNNKKRNIEGAKYLYADVRNQDEVRRVLGSLRFDVVVECLVYEVRQLKTSLDIFGNICDQYVFISTAGVYSSQGEKRIKESDEKNNVDWSYSRNKIECEKYLTDYCKSNKLKYTIVRPTVTYGNYRIPYPVATRKPAWTFFQRMIDGKPMLAGDNVKCSIIHIDDFSKMAVSLLGNDKAYNEDFHISSDQNDVCWDDVIRIAGEILNVTPVVIHVPISDFRAVYPTIHDEMKYNKNVGMILDDTKTRLVTGTEAQIGIEKGMGLIIENMRAEFEDNKLKTDGSWNNYCNATIYYAYKHNHLSEKEKEILDRYFHEHSCTEFKKSLTAVKRMNLKRIVKKALRKGKMLYKGMK